MLMVMVSDATCVLGAGLIIAISVLFALIGNDQRPKKERR